jgi:hypothetical protein
VKNRVSSSLAYRTREGILLKMIPARSFVAAIDPCEALVPDSVRWNSPIPSEHALAHSDGYVVRAATPTNQNIPAPTGKPPTRHPVRENPAPLLSYETHLSCENVCPACGGSFQPTFSFPFGSLKRNRDRDSA